MATRWLDDEEQATWRSFIAVVELLPGVLDTQMRHESGLTHFDYLVLAMLSEDPQRTLRMTALAGWTNATLPRLSHVVRRLEGRGLVERFPCPEDARATNARLTDRGWDTLVAAAPGHVETVRGQVFDALTPEQVGQLAGIAQAILGRISPGGRPLSPGAGPVSPGQRGTAEAVTTGPAPA
ncbi:MAG: regulatory protein MarR [Spirosoma sp.]|jgi:DNA-binding MarR family transcriptional regulator|nr:regulatory protein MarR [Friedmanniella sp.]MDB5244041.1 regulatory protein MarR [Spirosoma sp.]